MENGIEGNRAVLSRELWDDQLFLTGASADGKERYVMCLSAADGAMIWEDTIPCATPEAIHAMNSYATPTCATDGKMVSLFGPGGLHAWDLNGEKKWSLDLGDFRVEPGGLPLRP